MVGIIICCMDYLLTRLLKGRKLGSFLGYFHGTGNDVGDPCIVIGVEGIVTASEIDVIKLNESSTVSYKS